MIAKYDHDSYVDIDLISLCEGEYSSFNIERWNTTIVINGVKKILKGQSGKNIHDAFMWKHRNSIYDMVLQSPTYRKLIN